VDDLLKVVFDTPIYLRGLFNPLSSYGLLFTKWTKAYWIYVAGITEAEIIRVLNSRSLYSKLPAITETEMNIVQYMRVRHNLLIGEPQAEKVKRMIGSEPLPERTVTVKGRNLITGLPQAVEATSAEIHEALLSPLDNSRVGKLIAGSVYHKFRYAQQVFLMPEDIFPVSHNHLNDFLLACAKKANVDYLVTEDGDLLMMQRYHATRIVNAVNFLAALEASQASTTEETET
jgi:predicted nucleic acid-binding protein